MIIDIVHVDGDCRVFGRTGHRLLDDVRASASGHRDIALGQNHNRDLRTLTQAGQRASGTMQGQEDAPIRCDEEGDLAYIAACAVFG
jgi:hypothetical protein